MTPNVNIVISSPPPITIVINRIGLPGSSKAIMNESPVETPNGLIATFTAKGGRVFAIGYDGNPLVSAYWNGEKMAPGAGLNVTFGVSTVTFLTTNGQVLPQTGDSILFDYYYK